jgi:cell wall-associated NlpC family hydrolase
LLSAGVILGFTPGIATAVPAHSERVTARSLAALNVTTLQAAAIAVEHQAIASGALPHGARRMAPVQVLLESDEAMLKLAGADHPNLAPSNTTAIMGPVPDTIRYHLRNRPHHVPVKRTRTLTPFVTAIADGGSSGLGHSRPHDGAWPAPFQTPDGLFVDPSLHLTSNPTVGMVAVKAALEQLGQPYVWGGAGPSTFDCSGLVQWAYAHAGISLAHHAAAQWNEGRLIPGHDILPGDLIMFGKPIFHVGMYLGAGWMINAPYTGQYVNIVPVQSGVTGVIRP